MRIVSLILLSFFYLLSPALILYLCRKYPWLDKVGAVVIAYILGLVVGNIGILPEGDLQVQNVIMSVTIPLAIPLLLFGSDIKSWLRLAGKTVISLLIGIGMVVGMVMVGYFIFDHHAINDFWKVSGMVIGVYTGGTPNLAAIAMALHVDPNTYILTNTYDMFVSSFYLIFLFTVAQKFFRLFLPAYKPASAGSSDEKNDIGEDANPYDGIFKRSVLIPLLKAVALAVFIFACGAIPTLFLPAKSQMMVIILVITALGIFASLIPSIRQTRKTFEAGMYLILIFSVTVASMADIHKFTVQSLPILYYITFVIFGSLLSQSLLSAIFKIDADTMIITSTALVCSPPFVPAVASALKNREIIISGITVGIIGYAVGNFLGCLVAQFLSVY